MRLQCREQYEFQGFTNYKTSDVTQLLQTKEEIKSDDNVDNVEIDAS